MSLRALNSETADLCLQWSHILNSIESMTQSNPLDILSHLREVALPLHRTIPALITNSSLDETQKDALHKLHHTTKMIFNRCIANMGGANSDAIIDACAYGDTESVIAFVQAGKSLSRQELGLAIINASFAGHIDTVAPLVQRDWMISNGDLGQAVMNASLSGQVLFLEFLLSGQRPISEGCLGMAVRYAASQGQQDVINLLLSSGRQVSIDDFGRAVIEAARKGHEPCVQFLLSQQHIPEHYFHEAMKVAVEEGHLNIVQHLFSLELGSDELLREEMILRSSDAARLDILQYLLSSGPISSSTLMQAQQRAAGPYEETILDMLSDAIIIESDRTPQRIAQRYVMRLSIKKLQDDPVSFLNAFALENTFSFHFIIEETPEGVDLGGISKQVLTTLMTSLVEKNLLFLTDDGIPCVEDKSRLAIFEQLGRLYSLVQERNIHRHDKLLTGSVFSEYFFILLKIALQATSDDQLMREVVATLSSVDKQYSPFLAYLSHPSSETKTNLIHHMRLVLGDDQHVDPSVIARNVLLSFLDPMKAFLQGCNVGFRERIALCDPKELCLEIQGKQVDAEGLISALNIIECADPHFNVHIQWLKQIILSSDEVWQKAFLFSATGQMSLQLGIKINVGISSRGDIASDFQRTYFEFYTCTNTLNVPIRPMSKDEFIEALKHSIFDPSYNAS